MYIGDQIKMFFKWKVFLFFFPPFSPNGDQQFSFFICAEEQLRLCLQELAVLGFQYLKHIFWLHPFSHFLIRQQDKKLAERIIFIHWFEEKLWSCVQPSCPLVHVSPEHLLVAEACADPGVVLDTWIFTYRLWGGACLHLSWCVQIWREHCRVVVWLCGLVFMQLPRSRVTSLMCLHVAYESRSASVHPHSSLLTGGRDHCRDCFSV